MCPLVCLGYSAAMISCRVLKNPISHHGKLLLLPFYMFSLSWERESTYQLSLSRFSVRNACMQHLRVKCACAWSIAICRPWLTVVWGCFWNYVVWSTTLILEVTEHNNFNYKKWRSHDLWPLHPCHCQRVHFTCQNLDHYSPLFHSSEWIHPFYTTLWAFH